MQRRPAYILPIIILSQFAGTSLWFVSNAVLPELQIALNLSSYAVSQITSAVMFGFIAGTLAFAFFSLPDRFSPVKLFFISSMLGAFTNSCVVWFAQTDTALFIFRFMTGVCLAGIYPVGMKIAADWYEKGLGKALGLLVGSLVLGTAFPHLLRVGQFDLKWQTVIHATSIIAVAGGGLMLLFVGDGPFRKKFGVFRLNAFKEIFASKKWRQAAFGYFGHMWELYSFWGFVPLMLALYTQKNNVALNVPLISFLVIGCGALSCAVGGYLSRRVGSAKVATVALFISGCCCLLSPFAYGFPVGLFLLLLFIWGLSGPADSPQFSTLVAEYAPPHLKGTALTLYNSIGFAITTASLFVIDRLFYSSGPLKQENAFLFLAIGAVIGLPGMFKLLKRNKLRVKE